MKIYKNYLVNITKDEKETIILKVDQTEKIYRPNNIEDEDWIAEYVENQYGTFDGLEIINLDDITSATLNFEEL